MLRRPNWGLGLGLVRRNRIVDPELRKSVLPRRPASLDLPSSHGDNNYNSNHTRSSNSNNNQPTANGVKTSSKSLLSGSEHSTHNEKWSSSSTLGGSKKKTIRIVEEVLTSKCERDDLTESQKWKNLDDLVEMAYKIRVSYEFDWEKLLEEEEEDESEQEEEDHQPARRKIERLERPSVHLHKWRNEAPLGGPGVLIV